MKIMHEETENLKTKNIEAEKQESTRTEYFTDEELAKETDWIVHRERNTKKKEKWTLLSSRHNS
jgi:hypothetical protein